MKGKFAIKVGRDYYIGRTYTHQGEQFPGIAQSKDSAKWYNTLAVARRARATLANKISYEHNLGIVNDEGDFVD